MVLNVHSIDYESGMYESFNTSGTHIIQQQESKKNMKNKYSIFDFRNCFLLINK